MLVTSDSGDHTVVESAHGLRDPVLTVASRAGRTRELTVEFGVAHVLELEAETERLRAQIAARPEGWYPWRGADKPLALRACNGWSPGSDDWLVVRVEVGNPRSTYSRQILID